MAADPTRDEGHCSSPGNRRKASKTSENVCVFVQMERRSGGEGVRSSKACCSGRLGSLSRMRRAGGSAGQAQGEGERGRPSVISRGQQ